MKVVWDYRTQSVQPLKIPVTPVNKQLATDLLNVSGRYLSCIVPRTSDTLLFYFGVRYEEKGFLKFDLQPDLYASYGISGGFDLTSIPINSFLSIAEKYYAARNEEFYVPAVCFGVFDNYGYYVESVYGFERVEPFFIHSSHRFIARLAQAVFDKDSRKLSEYLRTLSSGQDELQLLEREPLMRAIIAGLHPVSEVPFYRQLSSELATIINQMSSHRGI